MLPRKERLSRGSEIREAVRTKQYEIRLPLLYLVARDNSMDISRLAVITPRLLGKAAKRNRLRRVFLSAFSKIKPKYAKNVDVVIFPRPVAAEVCVEKVAAELRLAFNRVLIN